jgi:hypothetical protein
MATEIVALAISLGILALIVILSLIGPRDRGGRLPGNGGPMLPGPHHDWDDGGDHGGDG